MRPCPTLCQNEKDRGSCRKCKGENEKDKGTCRKYKGENEKDKEENDKDKEENDPDNVKHHLLVGNGLIPLELARYIFRLLGPGDR